MKKGPLTKEEIVIIQESKKSIEELATELDRSISSVSKHYVPKTPKRKKEETQMLKSMGRHTRNGQRVATILTKGASELADDIRKNSVHNRKIDQSCIHRPFGKEEK